MLHESIDKANLYNKKLLYVQAVFIMAQSQTSENLRPWSEL